MNKAITPLRAVPAAFIALAQKVNEIISQRPPIRAGAGIKITESAEHILLSADGQIMAGKITEVLASMRTFFVTTDGLSVSATGGAINSVVASPFLDTSPTDSDKVYIDATVTAGVVTAVTISSDVSVPSSTSTHAYTLLATVAVSGGIATVSPVAWNYSQMQKCGSTYLWGGFGE